MRKSLEREIVATLRRDSRNLLDALGDPYIERSSSGMTRLARAVLEDVLALPARTASSTGDLGPDDLSALSAALGELERPPAERGELWRTMAAETGKILSFCEAYESGDDPEAPDAEDGPDRPRPAPVFNGTADLLIYVMGSYLKAAQDAGIELPGGKKLPDWFDDRAAKTIADAIVRREANAPAV